MIELIDQRKLKVHEVGTIIIDEADALLDEEHIGQTSNCKKYRVKTQVALFSATVPDTLAGLASDLLRPVIELAAEKIGTAFEKQRQDGYINVPVS